MKEQEWFPTISRFLRLVVLINLGMLAAVALACWFIGWRTAYQYGAGLSLAGMVVIIIALSSLVNNWRTTRSIGYQYGLTASAQDVYERTRQSKKDTAQSYGFFIRTTVVGIVSIVSGALIQAISS